MPRLFGVAVVAAILLAIFVLPRPWGYVAVAAAAVLEAGEALALVWWSRRRRAAVGIETLLGAEAEVTAPCRPVGQVRVHGELWRARCDAGADAGDRVRVQSVEGLTLVVVQ